MSYIYRWNSVLIYLLIFAEQCLLQGNLYEHGERSAPKECSECVCHDGNMVCIRVDPKVVCPPLPCDPSDQFTVPGECCKFCPGTTFFYFLFYG